MKFRTGSVYVDEARDLQRMAEVELTEEDAKHMMGDRWDTMSLNRRAEVLSALADIFLHQYAIERGLRDRDPSLSDITQLVEKYLK